MQKFITFDDTRSNPTGLPPVVENRMATAFATQADLDAAIIGTGGVVSPSVSRIIASSDPDTPLSEGDLLLLYAPPMAHFEDWGDGLSGWSEIWNPLGWTHTATVSGHAARRVVSNSTRNGLAYDSAPLGNSEVVAKIELSSIQNGTIGGGVGLRVSGDAGSEQSYGVFVRYDRVVFSRYAPGDFTTHTSSTVFVPEANRPYWVRFRIFNGKAQARFWHDDIPEPTTWMLEYSGLTELESGQVALLPGSMQGVALYHQVGIAELETGNESAATVAP